MITCHLINMLKAFQSPLQDKSQNWKGKNICAHTRKSHTRFHWPPFEDAAMNVLCLRVTEMQHQAEDVCPLPCWMQRWAGSYRTKGEDFPVQVERASANAEGYKVYIRYYTINATRSQMGAIKYFLVN